MASATAGAGRSWCPSSSSTRCRAWFRRASAPSPRAERNPPTASPRRSWRRRRGSSASLAPAAGLRRGRAGGGARRRNAGRASSWAEKTPNELRAAPRRNIAAASLVRAGDDRPCRKGRIGASAGGRAPDRAGRQPARLVGSAAQGCAQLHPVRPLQVRHSDGVRRGTARCRHHVRRRAARRPGGSGRQAVRRDRPANCSTRHWRRPGSTARPSTSPMRSSTSSSSQRGKRRIHNKPDAGEIEACRWWIEHERELIRPPVTVALGATAARSLIGKIVTISKVRGEPLALVDGSECWVTAHPSSILRCAGRAGAQRREEAVPPRPEAHQGARARNSLGALLQMRTTRISGIPQEQ